MIDYRKVTGTRNLRRWVLSTLSWLPDKLLVSFQYFLQTGKRLHLKNPVLFNEKLQAYKLLYHNPIMLSCTDKISVRDFVKEKGLENILIPIYFIKQKPEDIIWEELPTEFVIKTSDGGGGNEVIVCRNKNLLDRKLFYKTIKKWMKAPRPKKHIAREWAYQNKKPRRIIIEKLLSDKENPDKGIRDYKFFCFSGKFKYLWVDINRYSSHQRGFWNSEFQFMQEVSCDYPTFENPIRLPENIMRMKEIAEKLSEDFPFVRVDLYNVNGKIYFGELTFYPNSGYKPYYPVSFEKELGNLLPMSLIRE